MVDEDTILEAGAPLHVLDEPIGDPARVNKCQNLTVFPATNSADEGTDITLARSIRTAASIGRSPPSATIAKWLSPTRGLKNAHKSLGQAIVAES
jgi:hypothetical protein